MRLNEFTAKRRNRVKERAAVQRGFRFSRRDIAAISGNRGE